MKSLSIFFLIVLNSICGNFVEDTDLNRNLRGTQVDVSNNAVKNRINEIVNNKGKKWMHRKRWNHFKSYSDSSVKPSPYGDGVTKKFPIDEYLDPSQKKYMKYRQGPDREEAMSTSAIP